jgi:uncharacterized protein (TIGR03437 family)
MSFPPARTLGYSLTLLLGLLASAQAQTPTFSSVLNGASFTAGPIAPGEIAAIIGTNLGDAVPASCVTTGPLPTSCAGVSVLIDGKAAPLTYVSATQLSFQVPFDITGTSATVQVTRQTGGQTLQSAVLSIAVVPCAPGLSASTQNGLNLGAFLNSAGRVVSVASPVEIGEVVTGYGVGFGATNPVVNAGSPTPNTPISTVIAPVRIFVGGREAAAVRALLAPSFYGIYQIVFTVPQGLKAGNQPVVAMAGDVSSQPVLLPVVEPKPMITGVSNNASGQPGISSGSWVSIYGTALSGTTRMWQASDFSGTSLPAVIDGVSVKINGKSAAVYYVSPVQLSVQAPTDSATGPVQVQVMNSAGTATGTATLQTYAPGFFPLGKYPAAVHADSSYVAPDGYFGPGAPSRPAQPGETLLMFGTGFGPTTPAVPAGQVVSGAAPVADPTQLHIRIGGVPATVQFAGIVAAGEYQFNVTIPAVPDGDQPIVADIGGVSTQSGLLISVKN